MTVSTPVDEHDSSMKCMEVWGGNGTRENHFVRPGLDIWIQSQSIGATESGGSDLYLLSSCSSGRITRMMLADVCSHGTQFAELVSELRELMKKNINSIRQARFVRQISKRLEESSQQGCFATTMIGTYFSPTCSFSLCNSGHPPPLLYRAAEDQWSVLKKTPASMHHAPESPGVVDFDEYQHFETKLKTGDMILSYSNALTECLSADGHTLGVDGVVSRIRKLNADQPANLVSELIDGIRAENADNLAAEDATVLLCQATNTAVSWQDNLLAPFRMLKQASDRTKIE